MKSLKILLAAIIVSFLVVMPVSAQWEWGTPTQLTFNTAYDGVPSISGDGSKIAFMSNVDGDYEIYVINSDGTGLTQLTSNTARDIYPSISGDGSKIAFVSNVGGDYEIYVINSDGSGGLAQLTFNTAYDAPPSISGDGSKIAFTSYVGGDSEIYVINSDGTGGLAQLTDNSVSDRNPSISGDGSKIAFDSYSYVGHNVEIFVIISDGTGGLTQLTDNSVTDAHPSISGDGSKIAFTSWVGGDYEIYVINSDGTGGLAQLASNTAWYMPPSISGDGSKIAFTSHVGGDYEIYVINSDGTGLTQLTFNTARDMFPSISGAGSKIAFMSKVDGDYEIFVVSYTDNQPPTDVSITATTEPIQVGTGTVDASAVFTDPDISDTHLAVWCWGDDSIEDEVTVTAGSRSVAGSHTYDTPGVYTITLTVTDNNDAIGEGSFHYVVVYDPEGGFVTGGGWIDSPAGAYAPDPSLTGKANFGFVSKYKKGATVPTGQTEFQFKVADLNFHSDTYDWLVIAGPQAKYKGTGTINGEGNYGFMLSAIDEDLTPSTNVDLFRIKIWDKDDNDRIVYDNQMGEDDDADLTTAIAGGSIKIHKSK